MRQNLDRVRGHRPNAVRCVHASGETRNTNRAGSEEGRLFSQAIIVVIIVVVIFFKWLSGYLEM